MPEASCSHHQSVATRRADLAFRGYMFTNAWMWAFTRSFPDQVKVDAHKEHNDAMMYFLVLREFGETGLDTDFIIGNELSATSVARYEKHLHELVFPHPRPNSVRKQNHTNGWFMVFSSASRILACKQQVDPECNSTAADVFATALKHHGRMDCVVYDRCCASAPNLMKDDRFVNVKHWTTDEWHGHRHNAKCKFSPKNVRGLARHVEQVNTSICEQTFSWFRGYARTLNEMRPLRQRFLVLSYVKAHNELVQAKSLAHLGKVKRQRQHGHYACSDEASSAKAMARPASAQSVKQQPSKKKHT